jgi:hypothetical protein
MRRRWIAAAALITLPACAGASSAVTASPTPLVQVVSPTPAATAAVTPAATPQAFLAAIGPPCKASDLEMRGGVVGGAGGSGIAFLIFTDHGTGPCTLRGTPTLRFFDGQGRTPAKPSVRAEATGMFPTIPNSAVGLVPLADPGASGSSGVRGQAALPLQYSDNQCPTPVASVSIVFPSGTLTMPFQLFGSNFAGCTPAAVAVNPFQPAEGQA